VRARAGDVGVELLDVDLEAPQRRRDAAP